MKRACGFTLVEMLVSLTLLAVMSLLAWRGLDGLLRVPQRLDESLEPVLAAQTALLQWSQDLELARESRIVPVLDWQADVLRITRQAPGGQGLAVIAWFVEGGVWRRWASPAITTRGDLRRYWQSALTHSPPNINANANTNVQSATSSGVGAAQVSRADALSGVQTWQVYFFRGNAWVNPQSSAQTSAPSSGQSGAQLSAAPLGVRVSLQFVAGKNLLRDVALTLPSAQ